MDFTGILSDPQMRAELAERLPELIALRSEGLEGLDGGVALDTIRDGLARLAEGADAGVAGLEAIVERLARPVFLIQDGTISPPREGFGEIQIILDVVAAGAEHITAALPSVGRIDLRNHRNEWVGTGWMVAADVAVTNRHVAEVFAKARLGGGFAFRAAPGGRTVAANLDFRHEYDRNHEQVVGVTEVIWIEPDDGPDVALLRLRADDMPTSSLPAPVALMHAAEVSGSIAEWIAVIGYPAQSPYNDLHDQQRIFDGIYGVKRMAPGKVLGVQPGGTFTHDATTPSRRPSWPISWQPTRRDRPRSGADGTATRGHATRGRQLAARRRGPRSRAGVHQCGPARHGRCRATSQRPVGLQPPRCCNRSGRPICGYRVPRRPRPAADRSS
jgi:hypothetical protein